MKRLTLLFLAVTVSFSVQAQISSDTFNDFQDGTTQGWSNGASSPNPPTNIPNGGPGGAGDNFLEEVSSGGTGAGSRLIIFNNNPEWLGNYNNAGVLGIHFSVKNAGTEDLQLRLAFKGGPEDTEIASLDPVVVPSSQTTWTSVSFDLDPLEFVVLNGSASVEEVFEDVIDIRILSSALPSYIGDEIDATVHIDNIGVDTLFGTGDFDPSIISLYPNPVHEVLHIISSESISNYSIYTISGKIIVTGNYTEAGMDVSALTEGLYLIRTVNEGGNASVTKFIKH